MRRYFTNSGAERASKVVAVWSDHVVQLWWLYLADFGLHEAHLILIACTENAAATSLLQLGP